MQAAGAIVALAQQHAQDAKFMSPYIVEASRQGFELSLWEKLTSSSFEDGEFRLGTLRVCPNVPQCAPQCASVRPNEPQ